MHNFKEFLDYCESFYSPSHPDVLYPIDGLTRGELALATLSYLDLCAASDGTVSWGDGDSLDRERVRDFVINRRAIALTFQIYYAIFTIFAEWQNSKALVIYQKITREQRQLFLNVLIIASHNY